MRCGDAYVPSRLQSENKFPSHDLSQQQEQIKSCKQTAWSFKTISQTAVSFLYSLQNEVQKEFPLQSIAIEIIEGRSLSREQMMKEPQEKNNSRSSNQKKSRLLELLANSFVWRFEREMQLKFTFSTFPRFSLSLSHSVQNYLCKTSTESKRNLTQREQEDGSSKLLLLL